jgi:hypothetical protein
MGGASAISLKTYAFLAFEWVEKLNVNNKNNIEELILKIWMHWSLIYVCNFYFTICKLQFLIFSLPERLLNNII